MEQSIPSQILPSPKNYWKIIKVSQQKAATFQRNAEDVQEQQRPLLAAEPAAAAPDVQNNDLMGEAE